MPEASELPIQTNVSELQLAEAMFGTGIKVVNTTFMGDPALAGIYRQGDTIAPDARLLTAASSCRPAGPSISPTPRAT